ncbi:small integral membrane protein 1 [Aquarana catesbeiana]|uniref:small integral membrane protein 1 n=1 Tax=Aquarana catesbeiana TaxID=8400 RepID=UPI003CCA4C02
MQLCFLSEPPSKKFCSPSGEVDVSSKPHSAWLGVEMESQETPAVHYSRWTEQSQDEVSVSTSNTETPAWKRVYNTLCTGRIGILMKVLAGLALFWIIFIIGYVTGYYVHKCKKG